MTKGVYSITSLEPQYKYVAMMTCRYLGERTHHIFSLHGCLLCFGSQKVALLIGQRYSRIVWPTGSQSIEKQKESGRPSSFFMSTYIMDAICSMTPFPLMSWAWTPAEDRPIHVYHDKLWENKAEKICI
jgi:hypothetical protein